MPAASTPSWAPGGSTSSADLGAQMPMRTIGMLLGIPEQDQEAIRDRIDEGLRLEAGTMPDAAAKYGDGVDQTNSFEDYINWRAEHPSDDLMTELLHAEFEDHTGTRRRLSRPEVLSYVNLLAARGQRDHDSSDRLDRQGAGRSSRPAPAARRAARPRAASDRGGVAFRAAVTGAGPVCHQGRRASRADRARRKQHHPAQRVGEPRRPQVHRRRPLRHQPQDRPPPELRLRHPLLPRRRAGEARGPRGARRGAARGSRRGRSTGTTRSRPEPRPCADGNVSLC